MSFTFLTYLKVHTVAIKIVNHQLLKMNWRYDINVFIKLYMTLELYSRVQNWTKNMLEMLFIRYTKISSSFTVILNDIQEKKLKTYFLICSNEWRHKLWSLQTHEKHKNLIF